ncbi:YciI family protein [Nocardia australiensis]|uniref:YciI family protein n=1 Tax=Nocardia australiensis TaxID=2887191 RepID=UPI001D139848|nr:YciI family protein [Nocardia australiensis]
MPIFAVHYTYSEATVPGRDTCRPEHRAWLSGHLEAGNLLSSGPYPDGSGALLLFQAPDAAALVNTLAEDPFAREKLIDAVRAVEWLPVMGTFTS